MTAGDAMLVVGFAAAIVIGTVGAVADMGEKLLAAGLANEEVGFVGKLSEV